MVRLTRVELRRIFARKVVWLALVGAAAVAVITLAGIHFMAREINQAVAGELEWFNQSVRDWEENGQLWIQDCLESEAQEREMFDDPTLDFGCAEMGPPRVEDYIGQMPSLVEQYQLLLGYLLYPFLFLALAVGSTHVAAEFSHRTLGTWLTFEPRRMRVYLSKLFSAGLAALPMAAVSLTVILLGTPLVFRFHGVDDGMSTADWSTVAAMAARLVALAVASGVGGAALAFLVRHSGAVIGVVVGYLVVGETILREIFEGLQQYLLTNNIFAVLNDGHEWWQWVDCHRDVGCREIIHPISFTHGVVVVAGVIAVVALVSALRFARSDVD